MRVGGRGGCVSVEGLVDIRVLRWWGGIGCVLVL